MCFSFLFFFSIVPAERMISTGQNTGSLLSEAEEENCLRRIDFVIVGFVNYAREHSLTEVISVISSPF